MANLLLPLAMHKRRTLEMHCDKATQRTHRQFEVERERHTHGGTREREREERA
jgi:hypothetical protein